MANEARQTVPDSRPRVAYVLPDGREVAIIFDHGEWQPISVTYQLANRRVVNAIRHGVFTLPPSDHIRIERDARGLDVLE